MKQQPSQLEYWNGPGGEVWAREADLTDPRLEHFGIAVMNALAVRSGERILDVGCGAGATTRELHKRVAPSGQATGIDISKPLLEVARARGGGPKYIEADAGKVTFDSVFDKIFSRFGVMFFEDPRGAFANLRRLNPRGRLGFVCWRAPEENPCMTWAFEAVKHLLPEQTPSDPNAPGPFAFANREKVERIMRDAGWRGVSITAHNSSYLMGKTPEEATNYALAIGPLARAVREAPDRKDAVRALLTEKLAEKMQNGAITLPAATWIVTAT